MYSPPDDGTRQRMEAAHWAAVQRFGVHCDGAPVWGDQGSTLSRRAGDRWLRVFSTRRTDATRPTGEGIVGASVLVPDDVPRPRLHGSLDWAEGGFGYGADLLDFVPHPVISPHRPDLDHNPELPDDWWRALRRAVTCLGQAPGVRTTVRDSWIEKAFPSFSASRPREGRAHHRPRRPALGQSHRAARAPRLGTLGPAPGRL